MGGTATALSGISKSSGALGGAGISLMLIQPGRRPRELALEWRHLSAVPRERSQGQGWERRPGDGPGVRSHRPRRQGPRQDGTRSPGSWGRETGPPEDVKGRSGAEH